MRRWVRLCKEWSWNSVALTSTSKVSLKFFPFCFCWGRRHHWFYLFDLFALTRSSSTCSWCIQDAILWWRPQWGEIPSICVCCEKSLLVPDVHRWFTHLGSVLIKFESYHSSRLFIKDQLALWFYVSCICFRSCP
jgi:hypothetical protein